MSQAERDAVVGQLSRHASDGRLELDEFEARVEEAYQAKTRRELDHALRELPRERRTAPSGSRRSGAGFRLPPVGVLIAIIVALAFAVGPWMLWLLWPALCFGGWSRHAGYHARRDDYVRV
ncbi:MAG: DUF1707 SHOCT-like domain-containing protein [Acidimicrobiales bacterium]